MTGVDADGLDGVIVRLPGAPPVVLTAPRFDLEGLDGVVRTTISVPILPAVELPQRAPTPRPTAVRTQPVPPAVLRSTSVHRIARPAHRPAAASPSSSSRSNWLIAAGFAAAIAGGVASAIFVRSATGDTALQRPREVTTAGLSAMALTVVEPQASSTSDALLTALARCTGALELHVEVGADGQAAIARARALREALLERGAAANRLSLRATAGRSALPGRLMVQCRE